MRARTRNWIDFDTKRIKKCCRRWAVLDSFCLTIITFSVLLVIYIIIIANDVFCSFALNEQSVHGAIDVLLAVCLCSLHQHTIDEHIWCDKYTQKRAPPGHQLKRIHTVSTHTLTYIQSRVYLTKSNFWHDTND